MLAIVEEQWRLLTSEHVDSGFFIVHTDFVVFSDNVHYTFVIRVDESGRGRGCEIIRRVIIDARG